MAGINVFEVYGKLGLDTDEYEKALGNSERKTSKFASSLKSGFKTMAKVGVASLSAVATGVGAIAKQSVEAYAEYEQLIGGVETLYGSTYKTVDEYAKGVGISLKEAERSFEQYQSRQQDVLNNAANAYKTAGLSANKYMNTVNGFAASLTSSLGKYEWQAANYADMIVTDMADNANKMGTSMESIQNAYSGFAKQNYTMLDNLKLGYGGTKEEMERLLRDAEKYAGYIEGSLNVESFADVAEAIHIVQEEMGITGTTAKEASATISGSLASMKAAWQNVLVGMADDEADFDTLISNLVGTVGTFADNIMPRVGVALEGAALLISSLIPIIVEKVPALLQDSLPILLTAASDIITALSTGLSDNAPLLIQSALDLLLVLFNSLVENAPTLIDAVLNIINELSNWIAEYAYIFGEGALELVLGLAASLINNLPELVPSIVYMITEIVNVLTNPENLAMLLTAALQILLALGKGLVEAFPQLIGSLTSIIDNIVEFFTNEENRKQIGETAWELGKQLVYGLWEGVKSLGGWIGDKIKGWFDDLIGDVKDDQEIHSPSRKWARLLGKPMGQGVGVGGIEGLEESEQMLIDEVNKMQGNVSAHLSMGTTQKIQSTGGVSRTDELLMELISLFVNGTAVTKVGNTREMRRIINA